MGDFGGYLRTVREARRLSLDAVEAMTLPLPGRVTKSHLSKIENGRAEPSFPRMYALSRVYGVPISSLAERFEIDLRRKSVPPELIAAGNRELRQQEARLESEGRFGERLVRLELLLDRAERGADTGVPLVRLRLRRISCLASMGQLHIAKEECETLLNGRDLDPADRARALHHFARCCYRLGKFTIAMMAIAELENHLAPLCDEDPMVAQLAGLKGNLCTVMGNPHDALEPFREALDRFETLHDDFEACRFRVNYGVTLGDCGNFDEARRQLQRAVRTAREKSYDRQTAYGLHALGRIEFLQQAFDRAEPCLLESNRIGRLREYLAVVFCNCFYLWKIGLARHDEVVARSHERSLRSLLSRVPETLDEVLEFRTHETGGDR